MPKYAIEPESPGNQIAFFLHLGAAVADRQEDNSNLSLVHSLEKILTLAHSIDTINVLRTSDRWKNAVTAVTVSPKYQVVIPKDVRESMGIKSGQKIQVLVYKNRIELIPLQPIKKLRGIAKGIDTPFKRDEDRL